MNQDREWICKLLPSFARMPRLDDNLLGVNAQVHKNIFHYSRELAAFPRAGLHQLRHGGASMDALAGCDVTGIQDRGRWTSAKSMERYKRTAPYLRKVQALSKSQLKTADEAPSLCLRMIPVALVN